MSKKLISGILLVTGTAIGAGMLALPVVTAEAGFFPSFFTYLLCWGIMTSSGLLMLEICLEMPPDANLITMAGAYLGRGGKFFAWVLYLFLFYCLSVAYLSGGGGLLRGWIGQSLPSWGGVLLFLALLSPIVYLGAKAVDKVNSIFMAGLILSYVAFAVFCLPHVQLAPLQRTDWGLSWFAIPVIFTSFSYQGIIPTLTAYLKRDARLVRISIIGGTSAAFVIYLLWELLILGTIPLEGEHGLGAAKKLGLTAVAPLNARIGHDAISSIGQAFAFFAIATSFLGVTLGLFDFLADGLKYSKKGILRLRLAILTFGPPALVALLYPSLFLKALSLAGGIGCSLLLVLLPILMAYTARYTQKRPLTGELQLGGGKGLLLILSLLVLMELGVELTGLISY
jgi:tyrosine-specific transport protein